MMNETRFKSLTKSQPEAMKIMIAEAQKEAEARWKFYQQMAAMKYGPDVAAAAAAATGTTPPKT